MALWARYLLNGDGNDSSGNGRHLTVTNASYSNDRIIGSKSALFGDTISTNMYASYVGSPAGAESTVFSAVLWARNTSGAGISIMNFGGSISTNAAYRSIAFESWSNGLLYFTSPGRSDVSHTFNYNSGAWTMIGFVYRGGYSTNRANCISFIQNGRFVTGANITGGSWNPFPLNNNIIIGRIYNDWGTSLYTGTLSDIQLYTHELSSSEIWSIYEKSFTENKILSGSMI